MGIIIFNNISSLDCNVQVERPPSYQMPERDYDVVHVPGKSGDIVIDNGSYQNTTRAYQISTGSLEKDFTLMANVISEWLYSATGYARLEDSYEPEYYRLAMYRSSGSIENLLGQAGRMTISFDCKPQRFLKTGDESFKFTSTGKLLNPTGFKSLPIIIVNGNGDGVLRIGDYTVIISDVNPSITINSEIQDAYNGTVNLNSKIILNDGFPKLSPGENEVSFSGNITSVEVIPKWWTL